MKLKKFIALKKGFTLIELLVVIGIIAILTAAVTIAVNPGRQFAQARDTQRRADISALVNAVYHYAADNNGVVPSVITATPATVGTPAASGVIDLTTYLVPNYIPSIPKDPGSGTDANTGYVIFKNGNRVTASASGEVATSITITQ